MGTSYSIRVCGLADATELALLRAVIEARLERVNAQMSTWRADSELSRFNRHTSDDWFPVSAETVAVVAEGIRVGRETDGAFDITVGPLVSLWQFGPQPGAAPPTQDQLAAARSRVGLDLVETRLDPPALRKLRPDVSVDLSGIAKGYGVDAVARVLDEHGVKAYLVEIGGEVRARGTKPDGDGWRVGIETPTPDRRGLQRVVELVDQSMATSGDYRNFRESRRGRWGHILDPRTGRPVDHTLASVTVVGNSCSECDALATALFVLGPDRAFEWAHTRDWAVLLIVRQGEQFLERSTPAFDRLPTPPTTTARSAASAPRLDHATPTARATWSTALATMLLAVIAFGLATSAMAVGLLRGRRLRGSCGGSPGACDSPGGCCGHTTAQPTDSNAHSRREPTSGSPHEH